MSYQFHSNIIEWTDIQFQLNFKHKQILSLPPDLQNGRYSKDGRYSKENRCTYKGKNVFLISGLISYHFNFHLPIVAVELFTLKC